MPPDTLPEDRSGGAAEGTVMEEQGERPADRGGRKAALTMRRVLPLAILAAGLVGFFAFGLDRYVSFQTLHDHRDQLIAWVAEYGVLAGIAYTAVYALAVAFSVPGAVFLTIAGGFMFGPYLATLYVVIGATTGALAVFLAARYALCDYFQRRVGGAIRRMEEGFRENELSYMLILRLVPIFPFWLVNLVPAFLGVRVRSFVIGTLIGIIPAAFIYALVGADAGAVLDAGGKLDTRIIFEPQFIAPIIGLALLACIPIVYKGIRRWKGKPPV